MNRRIVPFLSALALVAVTGCGGKAAAAYPERKAKAGTATLPATPNLAPVEAPAQYPDGVWSVRGLLEADRATVKGVQKVRGTVAALVPCGIKEKSCKPAPYLQLTDASDGLGRRMLVGGERDLGARGFTIGTQVTVEGTFATSSPDGLYFAPRGLLLLAPLPPPPGADAGALPK